MNRYKVTKQLGDGTYGSVLKAVNRQVRKRFSFPSLSSSTEEPCALYEGGGALEEEGRRRGGRERERERGQTVDPANRLACLLRAVNELRLKDLSPWRKQSACLMLSPFLFASVVSVLSPFSLCIDYISRRRLRLSSSPRFFVCSSNPFPAFSFLPKLLFTFLFLPPFSFLSPL